MKKAFYDLTHNPIVKFLFEYTFDITAVVILVISTIRSSSITESNNETKILVYYSKQTIWILSLILISSIEKNCLYKNNEYRANKSTSILNEFINYRLKNFRDYLRDDEFRKNILSAKEIRISGNCLSSTLYTYITELEEAQSNGCQMKIIIANYNDKSLLETLVNNYIGQISYNSPDISYANSEQRIKFLGEHTQKNKGNLTVGYLPHLMNYGLFIIKGRDYKSDIILVKIYSHEKDSGSPTYLINRNNKEYYDHFLNEFDTLLNCCMNHGIIEQY